MIETVAHLAATGDIERIRGVVNATTTYILSAMGEGRTYDEALGEAQEAGYAEADPSFDVDGRDAAQKLAILASVAWGKWRPESDVKTEGIVGLKVEPGQTIRLVAEATPDGMSVAPAAIDGDRSHGAHGRRREHPRDHGARRGRLPGLGPGRWRPRRRPGRSTPTLRAS